METPISKTVQITLGLAFAITGIALFFVGAGLLGGGTTVTTGKIA